MNKLTEEHKRKLSIALKGNKNGIGNKNTSGHKLSEEHKRKVAEALRGHPVSDETKKKIREALKGKTISEEQKKKICETLKKRRGNMCSAWKGGITPATKMIRTRSAKYDEWRISVFKRDNFTCQECGTRGVYIEAHHCKVAFSILIQYARSCFPLLSVYDAAMFYTPLWDIDNGKTLCNKCHNKTKGRKQS